MTKVKLCFNCLIEVEQPYYAYFSHFGKVKRKAVCQACSLKLKNAIERCHLCYPYLGRRSNEL